MEFAKYYNVTDKMNQLIDQGKLCCYQKDSYKELFICSDTHDFWICRLQEGYNSVYEQEEGKWLIERNKIDKYEFCEFLKKQKNDDSPITKRWSRDYYIDKCFSVEEIIETVILMDDDQGLEGWDILECDSKEEAIESIDGGFGILTLTLTA